MLTFNQASDCLLFVSLINSVIKHVLIRYINKTTLKYFKLMGWREEEKKGIQLTLLDQILSKSLQETLNSLTKVKGLKTPGAGQWGTTTCRDVSIM